ncbi:hypothetical protein RHGRI_010788 [Rhododendron griersonianum]|uniref:Uncharacterized protein n=1 Tax=Rhododendron griersonianum TaxID=479676 RepID=A0AAV6KKD0_9ERIC|nr:hypothetical protein RHGRI_010788 [Rhododendron griersonianum]
MADAIFYNDANEEEPPAPPRDIPIPEWDEISKEDSPCTSNPNAKKRARYAILCLTQKQPNKPRKKKNKKRELSTIQKLTTPNEGQEEQPQPSKKLRWLQSAYKMGPGLKSKN